jgi:hypothetical protein
MQNGLYVPNNLLLAKKSQAQSNGSGLPGASEYRASTLTQRRFNGSTTALEIAAAVQNGTRTLAAITNDGANTVYINLDLPTGAAAGRTGVAVPAGGSLIMQTPFQFDGSLSAVGDGSWSLTILEGVILW